MGRGVDILICGESYYKKKLGVRKGGGVGQ